MCLIYHLLIKVTTLLSEATYAILSHISLLQQSYYWMMDIGSIPRGYTDIHPRRMNYKIPSYYTGFISYL